MIKIDESTNIISVKLININDVLEHLKGIILNHPSAKDKNLIITKEQDKNMLAIDKVSGRLVRVIVDINGVVSIRKPDGTREIVVPSQLKVLY